ncbi:MAG TPA: hypothetical protein VKM72_34550 [Thermoanaerobaculia bacterium]|nr:hypothetical protein [Thermoanaerobaculia bacterium]
MSPALSPVNQRGYLLVRRDGVLWGVSNDAVEGLSRDGARFRLRVGGAELGVDEVVGVVPELAVWPLAGALRRFWPDTAGGLAVHAEAPLVIVDPQRPPHALRLAGSEGEMSDGEGRR